MVVAAPAEGARPATTKMQVKDFIRPMGGRLVVISPIRPSHVRVGAVGGKVIPILIRSVHADAVVRPADAVVDDEGVLVERAIDAVSLAEALASDAHDGVALDDE